MMNIVNRWTPGIDELSPAELRAGAAPLIAKIAAAPAASVVLINGKVIWDAMVRAADGRAGAEWPGCSCSCRGDGGGDGDGAGAAAGAAAGADPCSCVCHTTCLGQTLALALSGAKSTSARDAAPLEPAGADIVAELRSALLAPPPEVQSKLAKRPSTLTCLLSAPAFAYGLQPQWVINRVFPAAVARRVMVVVTPSSSARVVGFQKKDKLKFYVVASRLHALTLAARQSR
jgi:hypothetical protein